MPRLPRNQAKRLRDNTDGSVSSAVKRVLRKGKAGDSETEVPDTSAKEPGDNATYLQHRKAIRGNDDTNGPSIIQTTVLSDNNDAQPPERPSVSARVQRTANSYLCRQSVEAEALEETETANSESGVREVTNDNPAKRRLAVSSAERENLSIDPDRRKATELELSDTSSEEGDNENGGRSRGEESDKNSQAEEYNELEQGARQKRDISRHSRGVRPQTKKVPSNGDPTYRSKKAQKPPTRSNVFRPDIPGPPRTKVPSLEVAVEDQVATKARVQSNVLPGGISFINKCFQENRAHAEDTKRKTTEEEAKTGEEQAKDEEQAKKDRRVQRAHQLRQGIFHKPYGARAPNPYLEDGKGNLAHSKVRDPIDSDFDIHWYYWQKCDIKPPVEWMEYYVSLVPELAAEFARPDRRQ